MIHGAVTGKKISPMNARLRKLLLTTHISASIGWIGAVAAFLALVIAGLNSKDAQIVRSAYLAMEQIALFVIVPLALTALLSGIIQGLATPWGLFRHRWVLVKLLLTTFATVVLLLKMPLIDYAARQAAVTSNSIGDLRIVGSQLVVHSAGGLLVLLLVTTVSVYKPWGLTQYGRKKLREQGVEAAALSGGVSRWVYVFGAIALTLLMVLRHLLHHIGSHLEYHGH